MRTCFLCSREVEDDLTVRVDFGLAIEDVCHDCAERGEEGLRWPDEAAPDEEEDAA